MFDRRNGDARRAEGDRFAATFAPGRPAVSIKGRRRLLDSAARQPRLVGMADALEFEFVFEPQEEGGYHVYAPDLPGLHTEGDDLAGAEANASEALALYVDGLREDGLPIPSGVVRRRLAVPA